MDFNQIFEYAKANPLLLFLVYFLFKDKLDPLLGKVFSFLNPSPQAPVVLPPPATPVPLPPAAPESRPLIDAILALLPVILPVILAQIEKSKAAAPAKE